MMHPLAVLADFHLLFVDDSLFFCQATSEDCMHLAKIFKDYENVLGKLINYKKSSLIFGSKINGSKKSLLQRAVGITNLGGV